MNSKKTKYDNILFRFKNHPVISWIILVAAFIIALAAVVKALIELGSHITFTKQTQVTSKPIIHNPPQDIPIIPIIKKKPPLIQNSQRPKQPNQTNSTETNSPDQKTDAGQPGHNSSKIEQRIIGRWKTDNEDSIYFHFQKIHKNRLYGSIWERLPNFTLSKENIKEGKIQGQQFSFKIKYQKTEYRPRTQLGQETDYLVDVENHYDGEIWNDKIIIRQELQSGTFNEFTAHKIFDKTKTSLKLHQNDLYTEAYVLLGDGCSIQALAIGSEASPLVSGGIMLISYTDKMRSMWDTATSKKLSGNNDTPCPENKNSIVALFTGDGKNDNLIALAIEEERHSISYYSYTFFSDHGAGTSKQLIKTEGKIGKVVIGHSQRIIVQEIISVNQCRMHILDGLYNSSQVVDCEDKVTALTINPDGSQIVWASSTADKTYKINVYNLESKQYIKTLEVAAEISSLDYSPTETQLAIGYNDGNITVINPNTGALQHTLVNGLKLPITNLLFNHNGKMIAATKGNASEITIWELPSEKILQILENKEVISAVAFGDNSRLLAAGGSSGEIRVWAKH